MSVAGGTSRTLRSARGSIVAALARGARARCALVVLALVLGGVALAFLAARPVAIDATARPDRTGAGSSAGVVVRAASLRHRPTSWLLDARIDIELPPAIRAGLDSGVPLEFVLELSLEEPRALRPDRRVLSASRRYGLVYYELTRHYRVRSFDDGTGRNYRSLPSALAGLGTLRAVPLGRDADGLAAAEASARAAAAHEPSAAAATGYGEPLRARLSLRLDGRALPLPLQSPFDASWRLPEAPFTWTHAGGDGATAMPARGARSAVSGDLS